MPDNIVDSLYIVQKGTVALTGRGHNHVSDLRFIQNGGSFGTETLYCKPNDEREHSAFAVTSCVLLRLSRTIIRQAIDNHCDIRYRVRIKSIMTLRRVARAVRDATAHVVHTLNVNEALQIFVHDVACTHDIIMDHSCSLIDKWATICKDAVERAGENSPYVVFESDSSQLSLTTLTRLHHHFRTHRYIRARQFAERFRNEHTRQKMILVIEHGSNLYDHDDDSKISSSPGDRWKRAIHNVVGQVREENMNTSLTRVQIVERQFEALEMRRKYLSIARQYRIRHRQELRTFLTNPKLFPPSSNMVQYFSLLHYKHQLTIASLRTLSAEGLSSATDIPLGHAIHIMRSLKEYPKTSSELEGDLDEFVHHSHVRGTSSSKRRDESRHHGTSSESSTNHRNKKNRSSSSNDGASCVTDNG